MKVFWVCINNSQGVLHVVLKARRQGVCCCHSHGQGSFHHHVIVHAISGGCQGYGLLSPDALAKRSAGVYPCLHCVPLTSVKDFIKIVQGQLQGREVAGGLTGLFCHLGWWGRRYAQAFLQSVSTLNTRSLCSAPNHRSWELHYYCYKGTQYILQEQTINISSKCTYYRCGCQAALSPS